MIMTGDSGIYYLDVIGHLYALKATGKLLPGYPILDRKFRGVMADLTCDGLPELVAQVPYTESTKMVDDHDVVLNADGTIAKGWPTETLGLRLHVAGNIDPTTPHPEVVGTMGDGYHTAGYLTALQWNGKTVPGFPYVGETFDFTSFNKKLDFTSPILAELDGDGVLELIAAKHPNRLYYGDLSGPSSLQIYKIKGSRSSQASLEWPMADHDPQHTRRWVPVAGCAGCSSFNDLLTTFGSLAVKNAGLKNALAVKITAAQHAFDRNQLKTAGHILCALLHHLKAQTGKGISEADAVTLATCLREVAQANKIPLPCEAQAAVQEAHRLTDCPTCPSPRRPRR